LVFRWLFTRQAEGGSSDCLPVPVAIYPDPTRLNGYLVMTEVMNADGTPHASNGRATIDDDGDFWFGFEQEIMDTKTLLPLGFLLVVILLHKECTTVQ
jgi:glutamine synthetase